MGVLYYKKESYRIYKEAKVEALIAQKQCERLSRFNPNGADCALHVTSSNALNELRFELLVIFLAVFFLALVVSFFLAKLSLRPMKEAQMVMDGFIESMIHDLNTPIASAKLNIESLLSRVEDSSHIKRIERIDRSLDTLLSLQTQLRASLKEAKMQYVDEPFLLSELLQDVLQKYEGLHVSIDSTQTVVADRVLIERVIDNLISNAIKYNKNANPVEVQLKGLRLHVKDRGQGIADVKRVFERYYREKSSMSGLGIGLMIVKSVCEHYGIIIEVKSTLGEGSEFILDFSATHLLNRDRLK